jgi:hypothetical protein
MSYSYKDNTEEVLSAMETAIERGLEAIGMTAEGHAKKVLTKVVYTGDKDYPLTGRLRNSITYAVSGKKAAIQSYSGDNGEEGGTYDGTAPNDKDKAVYIGTNVEYAPGIELGTHRSAGAVHFLQDAASNHTAEYKRLMEDSMKNA